MDEIGVRCSYWKNNLWFYLDVAFARSTLRDKLLPDSDVLTIPQVLKQQDLRKKADQCRL
jgi:hypothetical protein